jgi:dolichyl-phosphate-mannose-protein mannosyltransferase
MVYSLAIGCGIALLGIFAAAMFVLLKPLWLERRRELMLVAGLLAALTLIKCFLVPLFPGYPHDIFEFLLWGEVMTRNPAHVYDPQINCRYMPGYLYALWAAVAPPRAFYLGREVTDASVATLRVLIRIPPLVADFFLGLLVFAWPIIADREPGQPREWRGLGAVLLFAFNPALLFTSVAWGQNDSVLTLPVMLALLMVSKGNFALAAAAAALAVIVKLQGLIVLPILGIWMLLHGRVRDWAIAMLAFVATVVIAFAPFQIGRPWDFLWNVIASSAEYFPYTSLNAFNLMALAVGMRIRDSATLLGLSSFSLGMILLAALYAIAIIVVWRERSPRGLLYAAFLAYLGFFVLPARIHERYLYFALALLTPLALESWATLSMFGILTVTFLANQIITLRFLNGMTTLPPHDPTASAIASVNLFALGIAITYGLFMASKNHSRWPRRVRWFLEPFH